MKSKNLWGLNRSKEFNWLTSKSRKKFTIVPPQLQPPQILQMQRPVQPSSAPVIMGPPKIQGGLDEARRISQQELIKQAIQKDYPNLPVKPGIPYNYPRLPPPAPVAQSPRPSPMPTPSPTQRPQYVSPPVTQKQPSISEQIKAYDRREMVRQHGKLAPWIMKGGF